MFKVKGLCASNTKDLQGDVISDESIKTIKEQAKGLPIVYDFDYTRPAFGKVTKSKIVRKGKNKFVEIEGEIDTYITPEDHINFEKWWNSHGPTYLTIGGLAKKRDLDNPANLEIEKLQCISITKQPVDTSLTPAIVEAHLGSFKDLQKEVETILENTTELNIEV